MRGRLKLFPQFSPNLVHCQPPVEQFVLFPNQLHLGTALEGAPQTDNNGTKTLLPVRLEIA
jgi:hypothetical protein